MHARTLIGTGLAAALVGVLLVYQAPASAQGWGMMGGSGPGYHMGWGGRGGPGPGNCPRFGGGYGPGDHMRGWGGGPGAMMGYGHGGYGPGYHMHGRYGGHGPGMMYGEGYGRGGHAQGDLNLTTDQVKTNIERWLAWRGNPHLKLGEVKEKDADTITADVVTKDNSLVERFIVDRHTGFTRPDNS